MLLNFPVKWANWFHSLLEICLDSRLVALSYILTRQKKRKLERNGKAERRILFSIQSSVAPFKDPSAVFQNEPSQIHCYIPHYHPIRYAPSCLPSSSTPAPPSESGCHSLWTIPLPLPELSWPFSLLCLHSI